MCTRNAKSEASLRIQRTGKLPKTGATCKIGQEPRVIACLFYAPQERIVRVTNDCYDFVYPYTCYNTLLCLYLPAGFAKAVKDMHWLWKHIALPTEATLQQAVHTNIVRKTELLHCPQNIIYTDGSKRDAHLWHSHRIWCIQTGSYCSTATQGTPDRTRHAEHYQPR